MTIEQNSPAVAGPVERRVSRLWVWEDVLTEYTTGIVCVLAPDEATAWALLKEKDSTAWFVMRGRPDDSDDSRAPEELETMLRPRCVEQPEAFVVWGGG